MYVSHTVLPKVHWQALPWSKVTMLVLAYVYAVSSITIVMHNSDDNKWQYTSVITMALAKSSEVWM